MNWFLKMIGGEALAAEAVKQAKKEWQQELEAAIAADEADDIQQDQDISGLRVKYRSVINSVFGLQQALEAAHRQVEKDIQAINDNIVATQQAEADTNHIAKGAFSTSQSNNDKLDSLSSEVSQLWAGWHQHREKLDQHKENLDLNLDRINMVATQAAGWVDDNVRPLRERLDALEDALEDPDRLDPATTDAE